MRTYPILARTWAAVFLVVGLFFLLAPAATGGLLTRLANGLGLDGTISMPTGNLWYVLSLSLMSAITVLAECSARDPLAPAPYASLMIAKCASTAGFLGLAATEPAWTVCAAGDGFVALTLWLARPRPRQRGFLERWLLHAGGAASDVERLAAQARGRARRFDRPMRWLYPAALAIIDWLGPLLMLRRWRRARSLDAGDLDRLLHALRRHPCSRLLSLFALAPLIEAATEEQLPPLRGTHPLEGRLGRRVTRDEFDVIVVGSGAGGAPAAWNLARHGLRVAILEKGGLVRPDRAPRVIEKHYVAQGMTAALGDGGLLVLAGSALGGTTVVNSGTCLRPLPESLREWDAALGTRFAQGELDPWLDAAWAQCGVAVPPRSLLSASADVVDRGLRALGRTDAYVLPRNAPTCRGSGRCCFGCPTGAKRSTDRAFLPEALDAGAVLLECTSALRIAESQDRVSVTITGGRRLRGKHLVVSAGAFFTPGLLRRNRLGSAWRAAGDRLKVHPATKIFAHVPGLAHGERGVPQGLGYRPPELPRITMEGIHTPRSVVGPMLAVAGERHRWWMEHLDECATFGMMVRDRSAGRLGEIMGHVAMRYSLHPDDAHDLGAGLLLLAEAFFAAGADRVLLPVGGMPSEVAGLDELRRLRPGDFRPDRLMLCGFHPQGTAGMGRVVDPDLRLLGTRRISVCDASVLPDSPGVNPQITIMSLSLRLADRLAAELGRAESRVALVQGAGGS